MLNSSAPTSCVSNFGKRSTNKSTQVPAPPQACAASAFIFHRQSQRLNTQLDEHGRLRHFLSIEGLSRSLLVEVLDNAERFAPVGERAVKKVPLLRGRTVVNLFFEPSTRTRSTFELAAKRLSRIHI